MSGTDPDLDNPWGEAYLKIQAFIAAGATSEEVDEFTAILDRETPQPVSPEEHAQYASVLARAIRDAQTKKYGMEKQS